MLKPALARGELRCIGATTLNEYRKYVEKDAALARRFQMVLVGEPTVDDTVAILRGLKERFEIHHGVRIKDSAIVAAAMLSNRYITDRFLPDKAIDLIDEAGSALRLEIGSMPLEIDQIERRVTQLEIERQALNRETDTASRDRLRQVENELERLRGESAGLKERWNREKDAIGRVRAAQRSSRSRRARKKRKPAAPAIGRRPRNCATASLAQIEKDLEVATKELETIKSGSAMLKEEIDEEDIARIVAKWTGIPVSRMLEGEMQKLITMETRLEERVIGQNRGGDAGGQRDSPQPRRAGRSQPADRQLHFPGPDRRGQDRTGARARRISVRRRESHGARRHVRVHGEALGVAHDGRASRIRGLRRGRPAYRARAAQALFGGAVRRNRKGASGRVQRHAADSGGRPPDRRPGPHGEFPQHGDHHDLERRVEHDSRNGPDRLLGERAQRRRRRAQQAAGCSAADLPAGVSQPRGRHHRVQSAEPRAPDADHRHPAEPRGEAAGASAA